MPDPTPTPANTKPPRWRWWAVLGALFLSLVANVVLAVFLVREIASPFTNNALQERTYLGDADARDLIAVVRVEGVIYDSTIGYPIRQMEKAAQDKRVKAVVLRIDSPGGTVTASEELYQNIVNLRDNTGRRFPGTGPKPVAVSMGGLAASGGYYIATAGKPIAAERTTITGSIGVFAALPNVAEFGKEHGIKVELVKAGGIKASGSLFHALSPEERQTWQDTVDNAYDLFLEVIAAGRPGLTKEKLRDEVVVRRQIPKRDEKGNPIRVDGSEVLVPYTRVRADGGTFTTPEAKEFGLIDTTADLPAVIRATASAAGLSSFRAVVYDRTPGWIESLTGLPIGSQSPTPDWLRLSGALTPRLWFLASSSDGGVFHPDR